MPASPLLASLDVIEPVKIRNNLKPLKLLVRRRASGDDKVPVLTTAPSEPSAWLQIWHLGQHEAKRLKGLYEGSYLQNDPIMKEVAGEDALLVEIPGFVFDTGTALEFRVLGNPTFGKADALGTLTVQLADGNGAQWPASSPGLTVPISAAGAEDELDIACAIYSAAGNSAAPSDKAPLFHCQNLTHVIGSQLHEGGLLVCLYSLFPESDSGNDKAFGGFAKVFSRKYHPVGIKSGELCIGGVGMGSFEDFKATLPAIRDKVASDYPEAGEVKIRRLAIMTHGMPTCIAWGSQKHWAGIGSIKMIVDAIAPHVTDDVVVTLFACLAAFGGPGHGGNDFAQADRQVGQKSFAQTLLNELIARGISNPAVWAHASAGHATLNSEMRAFTKDGISDIVYLVEQPGFSKSPRFAWNNRFYAKGGLKPNAMFLELSGILHPGAAVAKHAKGGG